MTVAIRVEGLGKRYRLGEREPYKALRDVVSDALFAPLRVFRRRLNGPSRPARSTPGGAVWALRDVSFEVGAGEVVGVIGRNGAGKSTLLKILSRITDPTEGKAQIHGRVGSLLEVGTGFHPELTGRENVYLYAAILGMRKAEIDAKFEEIVAFAGVEAFVDTPVKWYSSGMQVRLAFAVAAHLEPEILLVDEVLAVGDAMFQEKCLGRMQTVAREGRTVLLVSHNMTAIQQLCERAILIDAGRIAFDGEPRVAVERYLSRNTQDRSVVTAGDLEGRVEGHFNRHFPAIRLLEIALLDDNGSNRREFDSTEPIRLAVTYECLRVVTDLRVVVHIVDDENRPVLTTQTADAELPLYRLEGGVYRSVCIFPPHLFGERRCHVSVELIYPKVEHLVANRVLAFDVRFVPYNNGFEFHYKEAWIRPRLGWRTEPVVDLASPR
jgi:lipopolysaccharide transport system ATP-binding protein